MEMCGHATLGATWLLDQLSLIPELPTQTRSAYAQNPAPWKRSSSAERHGPILPGPHRPTRGLLTDLADDVVGDILSALGIGTDDLASGYRVQNGCTSRTKTLIPVKSLEVLNGWFTNRI
ncbi:hypothetical protein BDV29DRAFT_153217 [Aspergillus leporis]|uniref:Uncharacterized protein n=1 Tax=Aspergillus leporis TaxID=41062 RepID=A0A5N5XFS8_9EURO|nr:hypothetical protein BDV29DRAFT_153217 [Aspergillus leporis]